MRREDVSAGEEVGERGWRADWGGGAGDAEEEGLGVSSDVIELGE